ncbi:MAG TPA: flagellin [Bryobacteraceae bacterium]|nr:flagellin [Bryobacteraceae bacterium]
MSFDILTNISSLESQNYLNANTKFQAQTINEVTSGQRIVNAGDDAAGLAVANTFRSDEAVLTQGIRNANDALSTLQTIDGGMSNISMLLDRASTLAAQSASQTFQGDRTVLDNEFQNVLTEINRQAQSIGMTQGGTFSKDMQVFIGGGRTDTTHVGSTAAITNGSVQVNLSTSLLDSNHLGLTSNGVTGANVTSASASLSTALGQANPTFDFTGSGFSGVAVTISNWNPTTITDQNALVTQINDAIASVGSGNASFAAAGIQASVNSSGQLAFTSSKAFMVNSDGFAASGTLLGTANNYDVSQQQATLTSQAAALTTTETLTFAYRDSTGATQQFNTTLGVGTITAASMAVQVNAAASGGIFAVASGTALTIMNANGGEFTVQANQGAGGAGLGIANALVGSDNTLAGTSTLDILNSTDATAAVTALTAAVGTLGQIQGTVGRAENQLGYAINLAQSQNTNLAASEAQIRDADMAAEAANLTKAQILVQAGTAALAQANSAPQAVLALLKG